MKIATTLLIGFSLFVIGCAGHRESNVVFEHAQNLSITQGEVDELWNMVCDLTHTSKKLPPPQIYFETFNPLRMNPVWLAWQKGWMKEAKLDAYPWGDTYEGFFYTGTSVIQIDPSFFSRNTKNGRLDRENTDEQRKNGKEVIAHEMLHYVLEQKDIPAFLQHCIMDQGGYERAVMSFVYRKQVKTTSLEGICEKTPKKLIEQGIKQSQAPLDTR